MMKISSIMNNYPVTNRWTSFKVGFNTYYSEHMARPNRIWALTLMTGIAAIAALYLMSEDPNRLVTSLLTGSTAMMIDFIIERLGISRKNWEYPKNQHMVQKVPLVIPALFFFCGILVTFAVYAHSDGCIYGLSLDLGIIYINVYQIFLLFTSLFFVIQYLIGNIKTLVFWALPLSIVLYISCPEPWILVISVIPMYLDYYLEKRLVKKTEIGYKNYDDDMAINIAVSYFVTSLLIFGIAMIFIRILD